MPKTPKERIESRRKWREYRRTLQGKLKHSLHGMTYPEMADWLYCLFKASAEDAQHVIATLEPDIFPYFKGKWYSKEHLLKRGVQVDCRVASPSLTTRVRVFFTSRPEETLHQAEATHRVLVLTW